MSDAFLYWSLLRSVSALTSFSQVFSMTSFLFVCCVNFAYELIIFLFKLMLNFSEVKNQSGLFQRYYAFASARHGVGTISSEALEAKKDFEFTLLI